MGRRARAPGPRRKARGGGVQVNRVLGLRGLGFGG